MGTVHDGFLAIWKEISDEHEVDYLHWLTREHVFERVGVSGFRAGRVFRNVQASPRQFFILYDLASAEVLSSDAYLQRLNQPTPWSQRTMPYMKNFVRAGGSVVAAACSGPGVGNAGVVGTIRFDSGLSMEPHSVPGQLAEQVSTMEKMCGARWLEVEDEGTRIRTKEKGLRPQDDRVFRSMLLVEGLDVASVRNALERAKALLIQAGCTDCPEGQIYTSVFSVNHGMS